MINIGRVLVSLCWILSSVQTVCMYYRRDWKSLVRFTQTIHTLLPIQ